MTLTYEQQVFGWASGHYLAEEVDATFKSFADLREHLIELLAWDNKEDERDYPLHTFSLKELLELGDYYIELDFSPNAYVTRYEWFN